MGICDSGVSANLGVIKHKNSINLFPGAYIVKCDMFVPHVPPICDPNLIVLDLVYDLAQ